MMLRLLVSVSALFVFLNFSANNSEASDHIDGPITKGHRVGDLSDLYAFPAPSNPNAVVLIMNTYPIAPTTAHFEERIQYVFNIRPLLNVGAKLKASKQEVKITCVFKRPHRNDSEAKCSSPSGLEIKGSVGSVQQVPGIKMFAGLRSDPFFFNSDWATAASQEGKIKPPSNKNIMDKTNCLSIVLEIDKDLLFPALSVGVLGVAVETNFKESGQDPIVALDRLGRPEITNVSMIGRGSDEELRDLYNLEPNFSALTAANRQKYVDRLVLNINHYDKADNKVDWTPEKAQALAEIFIDDYLVLDTSKKCSEGGDFLAVEKALIAGKTHTTCGGRQITDDIMDSLFSLYINKGTLNVADGVSAPYRAPSKQFPYLVKPDLSLSAKIKAALARKVLF